jgi:hypothetical protein
MDLVEHGQRAADCSPVLARPSLRRSLSECFEQEQRAVLQVDDSAADWCRRHDSPLSNSGKTAKLACELLGGIEIDGEFREDGELLAVKDAARM